MKDPKEEIMRMDVEQVERVSERFSEISSGFITDRQAMAFLMFKVKEMEAEDVADYMDIEVSTVYSLSSMGGDKFKSIKITSKAMEEMPWYLR